MLPLLCRPWPERRARGLLARLRAAWRGSKAHDELGLNVLSIMAAAASAWLWWRASEMPIPPSTAVSWEGKGPFTYAPKRQAALNSQAAIGAALAALCQVLTVGARTVGL